MQGETVAKFNISNAADLTKQLYELIVSGAVNELKEGASNGEQ